MRYVAMAAATVAFWILVAAIRLVLHGDCYGGCEYPREALEMNAAPLPLPVSPLIAPPPTPRNPIRKMAVVRGMNAVKPEVAHCYQEFQMPGLAMVNVVIARNGRVSSANVIGKFAGTPTGACVEQAVMAAEFPPSEGLSTPYPFQLR